MRRAIVAATLLLAIAAGRASAAEGPDGMAVYRATCAACHDSGAAGAPKLGDRNAWLPRLNLGIDGLHRSGIAGKGAMPAKGGRASLTPAEVEAAVNYMVLQVDAVPAKQAVTAAASPNAFNRLLRAPGRRNAPPPEDGIHDPTNEETFVLQAPLVAFGGLPRSNAGNRVDWGKALAEGKIAPRHDRLDAKSVPAVMDLNIVREVKGSMPDVVFPHKQHTQWLDCSNCHPAIFKPQKGANQISMASILLGEACGVCHGKVAFPVSDCRLCHSKNKAPGTASTAAK